MWQLFHIKHAVDIVIVHRDLGLGADPEEIDEWRSENGPGPTLDPICPDWRRGDKQASWNEELSGVFAASFLMNNPDVDITAEKLKKMFMERLDGLKTLIWQTIPRTGESQDDADTRLVHNQEAMKTRHRRNRRRVTVSTDIALHI